MLHYAVQAKHLQRVKELLDKGASINNIGKVWCLGNIAASLGNYDSNPSSPSIASRMAQHLSYWQRIARTWASCNCCSHAVQLSR